MDLTRIYHDTVFVSEYLHIPIHKSLSHWLLLFLTLPTELGDSPYPDMEAILGVYLRDKNLENLPYITGYCGEFDREVFQQAGTRPSRLPGHGMSACFIHIVTTADCC